jgi:hypothetical protein
MNKEKKTIRKIIIVQRKNTCMHTNTHSFYNNFRGFFWHYWGLNSRLVLISQALYWATGLPLQPFCSGYLGDRASFFAQVGLDCNSPTLSFLPLLGEKSAHRNIQLFSIEMGSQEAQAGLKL